MGEKRIDDFLDGIEQMFSNMQTVDFWPAHAPQMDSYYIDILAKDFYLAIQKLRKEKTAKEIAGLFDSAGMVRSLLYNPLVVGMKVLRCRKFLQISLQENVDFIRFVFDVLREKTNDDLFCLSRTNKILSDSEVHKMVRDYKFSEVKTDEVRKGLSSLNITLQSSMWSFCFDVLAEYGMEIHGPYDVSRFFGPNSVLVIRDFFDFKQPVWGLNPDFNKVSVMNIYRGVKFEFDMANHFVTDKPLAGYLTHWCVLVDGSPVSFVNVKQLDANLRELRKRQVGFVNSLKPYEIIEKSAEINYYTFRNVWEAVGEKDWRFSMGKVRGFINEMGLKYWQQFNLKEPREISHYRRLYDPRLDYPIE